MTDNPGTISDACEMALTAADLTVRDRAAAALVRHYAALMDRAEQLAGEAEVTWGELSPDDIDGRRRLAKLETMLGAQNVASDLGPKLLAVLTALGCTLAGRGERGKDKVIAADPQRIAHDEISERRAARRRQHDATAVDTSAP